MRWIAISQTAPDESSMHTDPRPLPMCAHYWPQLRNGCDAGYRAPLECVGCPRYHDGTPYLSTTRADAERMQSWQQATGEKRAPAPPANPRAPRRQWPDGSAVARSARTGDQT